uniref:Neuropeptide-like 1 n=1 Tax=Strigamia maritima TaxID=126957 RepID=T1IV80_STRMM
MQGRTCLRMLLLAIVFSHLTQGALQDTGPEATTISGRLTELSGQQERIKPPVKRYVGSVARAGGLPPFFHGKRHEIESTDDEDENNEIIKRYLGSIVRQGIFSHNKRQDEEEMLDDAVEKRHLGSVLRAGDSRLVGRDLFSSLQDKRFMGSLARAGELGPGGRMSGKKRYLGSVARVDGIPFRAKRTPQDTESPDWESEENLDDNEEDVGNEEEWEEDDLLIPFKRNIASLARNGWLPHTRSLRRHDAPTYSVSEEAPKRNIYYRPASASGRSRLLGWLRREEARLKEEAEARNGQGKRTIAALARSGELPVRYRFSRSADRLPAPPFMRMATYRGGGGGGYSIRSPHAFASLHEGGWNRFKRSFEQLDRMQMHLDALDDLCDSWDLERCGPHKGEKKSMERHSSESRKDEGGEMSMTV